MNQNLKKFFSIFLIYISSIIFALLLSKVIGVLYSNIFNLHCSDSLFIAMNFDRGCMMEGFIYTYSFVLPLLSFILLKTRTAWLNYCIGMLAFIIFSILVGYYKGLFIYVILLLIGWLLAQGSLMAIKKLKNN